MSNHLKGLLIAFFGVLVLTPEGILVKLANSDSFTILPIQIVSLFYSGEDYF